MEKTGFEHYHDVKVLEEPHDEFGEPVWTEQEERAVRRKLDWHIVPVVTLLYLLCFIDRANIGNARIQGMAKDLKLIGYRFNWALTVFYFTYILVEIPSNIILKRVGARYYIPFLVLGFGAVSVGFAFIKNFTELLIVRIFLGVVEGGTMPGISFYLSCFYKREELLFRVGLFVSAASLAGAFGGLLASGLTSIGTWGVHGSQLHTWRNIFFFEGIITMCVAIAAPFLLPQSPETSSFLTDRQRSIAAERLVKEHKANPHEHVNTRHVKMAMLNINNLICALGFLFANISVQSISLFLPTILNDMGYKPIQAQLHTVPVYVVACVFSVAIAFISDRMGMRGIFLLIPAVIGLIGFIILRTVENTHVKYMAVFFAAMGAFPGGPGYMSWALNNAAGPAVRAVTGAYVVSIGTVGAIVATWTYLPKDAPKYPKGHDINIGAQSILIVLAAAGIAYCVWENRQRISGKRDDRLSGLNESEKVDLGYKDPEFRYIA